MVGDGSILFSGVQKFPRLVETSRNVAQSDWTYSKLWLSSLLSLLLWLFNQRRRISPTNTPYRNNIWVNYGDVLRYTGPNSSNFECESGAHLGFAGGENQTSPPLMLTSNVAWHIPWYPYPSLNARSWNNVPQNLPSENRLYLWFAEGHPASCSIRRSRRCFFLVINADILPAHIFFWGFLFVSLVPIGKLRLTILGYVCGAPLMLDWPLRIDQHFDTLCTEIYVCTVDVYKDYIDTCSRPWCIIHPKASPRSANSAERIVIATRKGKWVVWFPCWPGGAIVYGRCGSEIQDWVTWTKKRVSHGVKVLKKDVAKTLQIFIGTVGI